MNNLYCIQPVRTGINFFFVILKKIAYGALRVIQGAARWRNIMLVMQRERCEVSAGNTVYVLEEVIVNTFTLRLVW